MTSFPARLKQTRQAKGYSLTELAEKTFMEDKVTLAEFMKKRPGISLSSLSRLEDGSRLPSVDQLLALANALQCSTDFLLDREDKYPILCSNCGGKGVVFLPQVRPHPAKTTPLGGGSK